MSPRQIKFSAKLFLGVLIASICLAGAPVNALFDLIERSNIVDALYLSKIKSGVVDNFGAKTANAAYTGKVLRTVEYTLGGSTYNPGSAQASNTWRYAGNAWGTTAGTDKTIYLKGSGIKVKNAYLNFSFTRIGGNTDVTNLLVTMDVNPGPIAGTFVNVAQASSPASYDGGTSDLHGFMRTTHDVTALFATQSDAQWSAGVGVEAGTYITGPTTVFRTVKLIITYEADYTSTEAVKTVRFPLSAASERGTKQAACAGSSTCGFTYTPQLPDAAADGDIYDVFFDITAETNSATASTLQTTINGGTAGPAFAWVEATTDQTNVNVTYRPPVGGNDFTRSGQKTLNIVNGSVPLQALGGEAVVTYKYATNAATQTDTVRYFVRQDTSATPGAGAINYSQTINISNTGLSVKNVWLKMHAPVTETLNLTVNANINGGTNRAATYAMAGANSVRAGAGDIIYHEFSDDVASISGNSFTIGGSTQYSIATGDAPLGIEAYVTFTWSGSLGGTVTKTVAYNVGQQGVSALAAAYNNAPSYVTLPETVTKTHRSTYLNSYVSHSNGTSITAGNVILGVNGTTATYSENAEEGTTTTAESYHRDIFHNVTSAVFTGNGGTIGWTSRVFEINANFNQANEAMFSHVFVITYDAALGNDGTAGNSKILRTVEYTLGGSTYNPGAGTASNTWIYSGAGHVSTSKSTDKTIFLKGTNIKVKNAYLNVSILRLGVTDISDSQVTLDVTPGPLAGTSVQVGQLNAPLLIDITTADLTNMLRTSHDVTALFATQSDAEWSTGVGVEAGTRVTGPTTTLRTIKLIITYEADYASTEAVKTVRFPLNYAGGTGSAACAASTTCQFGYSPQLPDAAADGDIYDVFFDVTAETNSNVASNFQTTIAGGTAGPAFAWVEAIADHTNINVTFRPTVGGANFNRSGDQTLNIVNGSVPLQALGGEVVVTYKFSTNAATQAETVRYFVRQDTAAAGTTPTNFSQTINISNTGLSVKNVWLKMHTPVTETLNLTVNANVNGGSNVQGVYQMAGSNSIRAGASDIIYHNLSGVVNEISGSSFTLGGSTTYSSATGDAPIGIEAYVTFTWSGSARGTQTKTVLYGIGQQGVANVAANYNNYPSYISLPESVTKTHRSTYLNSYVNHNNTANITAANVVLGVNGTTTTYAENAEEGTTATAEGYHREIFHNVTNSVFSGGATIDWSDRVFEINANLSVANRGVFSHAFVITYDSAFPVADQPDLTVSSIGTQATNLTIPSTNQFVGGAFTMVRPSGAVNVTGITVTVNDPTGLFNLEIYTDTAASCSTADPTTATLFGSMGVGLSSTNAITGSASVGATTRCFYVVFDVSSGAANNQTVEVSIASSAHVTAQSSDIVGTFPVAIAGTTTLQQDFITVSGTIFQANGITPLATTPAVKLAVSNNASYSTTALANGTFSFDNVPRPTSLPMMTVWLDTNAGTEKASLVFRYGNATCSGVDGDCTGLSLIQESVIIGVDYANTANTINNGHLSACDNNSGTACNDADIGFTSDLSGTYNLNLTWTTNTLHIKDADAKFAPGGAVTMGGFKQSAGSFTGGSAAISMGGDFTLSGGAYTATSATTANTNTVGSTFTISGGTFTHSGGTVSFTGNGQTLNSGSAQLNTVTVNNSNPASAFNVTGTVNVINLNLFGLGGVDTGSFSVTGNIVATDSNVGGTGSIIITGSGAQILSASGGVGMIPAVSITKTGGSLTIQDTIYIYGNITNTATGTTFTTTGSTVEERGNAWIINVGSLSFNNFKILNGNPASSGTITGTLDVKGNLTLGNGVAGVSNLTGTIIVAGAYIYNNPGGGNSFAVTMDGNGAQTITHTSGTMSSGLLTISKTNPTDTVTLASDVALGGGLTITEGTLSQGASYNLTVNGALDVQNGATLSNIGTGDLTLGGNVTNAGTIILNSNNGTQCTDGADDILIRSTVSNTLRSWSGAGTFTIYNVDVDDMTGTITAYTSVKSADTTWTLGDCGITISGSVYLSDETTKISTTPNIKMAIGTTAITPVAVSSGDFTFTGVTTPSAGQVITIWVDANSTAGTNNATLIFKYGSTCAGGTANCTGLSLYEGNVIIGVDYNNTANSITNADLAACDNDTGAGCTDTDIGFTSNGSTNKTLTATWTDSTLRIKDAAAKFTPDYLVSLKKFWLSSGTLTSTGESFSVFGSGTGTSRPFKRTGGTFAGTTLYVDYYGTADTEIETDRSGLTGYYPGIYPTLSADAAYSTAGALSVNDFDVNPGGTSTLTFNLGGTLTVSNSFFLSATSVFNTNNNSITVANLFYIYTGTTFNAGSSTITINGTQADTVFVEVPASFVAQTSTFIYAKGGPTVENLTYNNLNIGTVQDATAGGTNTLAGDVTVGNVLTIGNASSTNSDTLSLSTYTINLTGSGTPFVITTKGALLAGSGTVNYNGSSATNVAAATYHNLGVGTTSDTNAGVTYTLAGNINVGSVLTIGNDSSTNYDTLDSNSNTIELSGSGTPFNRTAKGSFGHGGSIVRYTGTSNTTIPCNSTYLNYNNLSLRPVSGNPTYTIDSCILYIYGLFTIGTDTAVTLDLATNDPTVYLYDRMTIGALSTFIKQDITAFRMVVRPVTSTITITDNTASKQDLGNVLVYAATSGALSLGSDLKVTQINLDNSGGASGLTLNTYTLTILGSGTTTSRPFIAESGTIFTPSNGTIVYAGSADTDVEPVTYNNLTINAASGTPTFTLTGNTTVSGALNITTGAMSQGASYNLTTGAVTLGANGIWSNLGTGDITLSGNVSNAGTITINAGGGGNCDNGIDDIVITSTNTTVRDWSGAGTFTLVDVNMSYQNASVAITVYSGTNGTGNTGSWNWGGCGITISGSVYLSDETTKISTTPNIKMAIGTTAVTPVAVSSGDFTFTGVTAPSAGQVITIWVDAGSTTGTNNATLVFKYGSTCAGGTANCTGLSLYEGNVIIGPDYNNTSNTITNADLAACDNDTGCGNDTDLGYTSNSGALSLTWTANTLRIKDADAKFAPGGDLTVVGFKQSTGSFWGGTGTIAIYGNLVKAGGTFSGQTASIGVGGDFTTSGGSFNSTSGTLTLVGNATNGGGTFNPGTGFVVFAPGNKTVTITGDATYNNLEFKGPDNGGHTATFTVGATHIVTGTFKISGTGRAIINGGGFEARGDITLTSTSGSTGGTTTVTINGTGPQILTGSGVATEGGLPNVVINKASGDLTLSGIITSTRDWTFTSMGTGSLITTGSTVVFWREQSTATITGTHTLNNVIFQGSGNGGLTATYTVINPLTVNNLTFGGGLGKIELNGSTINVTGNLSYNAAANTGTTAITMTGSNPQTVTDGGGTKPTGLFTINKANPTDTVTLASGFATGGALTITQGTLSQGASYNLTINGALSLGASGILSNTGTGDLILGGNVVNNGTITLNGNGGASCDGDNDDILFKSTDTTVRTLGGTGTYTLEDVTISYLNATVPITATSSTNSTGNVGSWTWASCGIIISGNFYALDETTAVSGANLMLSVAGGVAIAADAATDTNGAWAFTGVSPPSAGQVITIWVDANSTTGANNATLVFKYGTTCEGGTTDCTGLKLFKTSVIIGVDYNNTANTITNADLAACDNDTGAGCADTDVGFTANEEQPEAPLTFRLTWTANALRIKDASAKFASGGNVIAGGFYQSAGTVSASPAFGMTVTGDFTLSGGSYTGAGTVDIGGTIYLTGGSFTATDGNTNIGGDWRSESGTPTFDANGGTVVFDATSYLSIRPGSVEFDNVNLNTTGASGVDVEVIGTMVTNGTLAISKINTFVQGDISAKGNVVSTDSSGGTGWGGLITFDGGGAQTLSASGGTGYVPGIAIDKATGILTVQDTIRTIGEEFTYYRGTVNFGTSTIVFGATDYLYIDSASLAFNNVTFDTTGTGGAEVDITGTMNIDGNLTITTIQTLTTGTISLKGNWVSTDTTVGGDAQVVFTGANSQTITDGGGTKPTGLFTINKTNPTDTVTLASDFATGGALTITQGTLSQGASYNLTVNGALTIGASGTLSNTGTGDLTLGGNVTNAGTIILNSNNGAQCTDGADDILIRSTVNNTLRSWSGAGTFTIYNVNVDDMTGTITAYTSTLSGDTTWTVGSCGITISGSIYLSDETTKISTTPNIKLFVGTTAVTPVAVSSGDFTFTGVTTPALGSVITIFVDANSTTGTNNATLVFKYGATCAGGTANCTGLSLYEGNVIIGPDYNNTSNTITNADLATCDNDTGCGNDTDLGYTSNSGALSLTWTANTLRIKDADAKFAPGGAVAVGGLKQSNGTVTGGSSAWSILGNLSFTSGTFTATSGVLSVSGSVTTGGTFNHNNGTFDYNGPHVQTVRPLDYNNLTVSNIRDANVVFASGSPIRVAGSFNVTATFTSGNFVTTGSNVNYNGTGAQTITAFKYFYLTISNARIGNPTITFANTGTIEIGRIFYLTSSGHSLETSGSTVHYNTSTTADIIDIDYYHLITRNTNLVSDLTAYSLTVRGQLNQGIHSMDVGAGGLTVENTGTLISTSGDVTLTGNLFIDVNGTYTKGTGIFTFKKGSSGQTITDNTTVKQDLGAIRISSNTTNTTLQLGSDIRFTSLTIDANQTFDQGASFSFTTTGSDTVFINSGNWTNTGTGDITLSGNVTNAGTIILNSNNGTQCTDGADDILIRSTVNNTLRSWSGAGTFTIYNVNVDDMTGTITAYTSTLSGDTTWTVGSCGITISGSLYGVNETTPITTGSIKLSVAAAAALTQSVDGSGAWSFTVNPAPSAGQVITIWTDGGTDRASLVFKYGSTCEGGTTSCVGLKLFKDNIIIGVDYNNTSNSISNADLSGCDNDTGAGCADTDIGFTSNAGNLALTWLNNYIRIKDSSAHFSPGGDVVMKGFKQSEGIFTGATNVTVEYRSNNYFIISGGTFNAPANLSISGFMTNVTISGSGVFNEGSGTVTFVGAYNSLDVNVSETFHNLVINKDAGNQFDLNSSDKVIVTNNLELTEGSFNGGTIEARGSVTIASTLDLSSGTLDLTSASGQTVSFGGGYAPILILNSPEDASDSYVFTADTVLYGVNITSDFAGTVPFVYNGHGITTRFLTLAAGTFNAPSNLTINGFMTEFSVSGSGVFNEGEGTVIFAGLYNAANVNVTETFYNLTIQKDNLNQFVVNSADKLIVTNTLNLIDGIINDGTIEAKGAVNIYSTLDGGTTKLIFSGTSDQTYTDNGGNEPDGDITIDKPVGTKVILASDAEWNASGQDLTVTSGTLDQGATFNLTVGAVTIAANGTLTNTGTGDLTLGGNVTNAGAIILNSNNGTQCTNGADDIVIDSTVDNTLRSWSGTGTFTIYNVNVDDMTGSGVTAYTSVKSADTTWTLGSCGTTITVQIYDPAFYDPYDCSANNLTVALKINGAGSSSASCTASNGTFQFTDQNVSANALLTAYVTAGSVRATTVYKMGSSTSNFSMYMLQSSLYLKETFDAPAITNADLDVFDSGDDSNIVYTVSSNNLILEDGAQLFIGTSTEYAPGGTVTTSISTTPTGTDGDIICEGSWTLGSDAVSIGGNLDVASCDISSSAGQTMTFTGTGSDYDIYSSSFDAPNSSLVFDGSGSWRIRSQGTVGSVVMNAGTLNTVTGATFTVRGNVIGNGTISMSMGTFVVDGDGNFGGSTNWVFNNLRFGDGTGTTATSASGTGGVTVNGVLTVAANQTLNAGSKTWTLAGSGTPFVSTGAFNRETSTIIYTGTSATNITAATYHHLHLLPAGTVTHTAAGAIAVTGDFVLGNGTNALTFDVSANNPIILVAGNMTISENVTYLKGAAYLEFLNAGTKTLTDNRSVKGDIGALSVYNTATLNLGSSVTVTSLIIQADTVFSLNGSNTLTVTGSGSSFALGQTKPFSISGGGVFEPSTGTVNYVGNSASTTLLGTVYHNLGVGTLSDTGSGTTYSLGGNTEVKGTLTIGNISSTNNDTLQVSSYTLTLSGTGTPLNLTSKGTFDPGSGTAQFTGSTATITSVTYNNLTLGGTGTYTLPNSDITVRGNLVVSPGAVVTKSASNKLIFAKGGGGTQTVTGNLTNSDLGLVQVSANSGNTTLSLGSSVKFTSLTVDASQSFTLNGSNTLTLIGSGSPLVVNGTFTPSTGTVEFLPAGAVTVTVPAINYNHLSLNASSAGPTFTLGSSGSQTINVSGNLVLGNGTNAITVNSDTNNPNLTLYGDFTINKYVTYNKGTGLTTFKKGGNAEGVCGDPNRQYLYDWTDGIQDIGNVTVSANGSTRTCAYFRDGVAPWNDLKMTTFIVEAGQRGDAEGIVITGSGTGASRPMQIEGSFTNNGEDITFKGTSTTEIDTTNFPFSITLYFAPESGSPTYILGSQPGQTLSVGYDVYVGDGTNPVTLDLDTYDPSLTGLDYFCVNQNATVIKGSGTINAEQFRDDTATKQDLGNIAANNIASPTLPSLLTDIKASTLTVDTGKYFNLGDKTLTLTGNNPITSNGNFSADTGTIDFAPSQASGNVMVPSLGYYNVKFNKASNIFQPASSAFTVANNLDIIAGSLDLSANDPSLTVNGALTIGTGSILSASDTSALTLKGDFVNNGTFTHNGGTVTFVSPTANGGGLVSIKGTVDTTFHNLSATMPLGVMKVKAGSTQTVSGILTLGGEPGRPMFVESDVPSTQWHLRLDGSGTLNFVIIKDSGCHGSSNSVTSDYNIYNGGNNGTCWGFKIHGGNSAHFKPVDNGDGGGTPTGGGGNQGGDTLPDPGDVATTPLGPSVAVNDNSVGFDLWSIPGNATVQDGSNTVVSLVASQASQYLKATGFGFDIPSDALVKGILVEWKKSKALTDQVRDYSVKLVKAGTVASADRAKTGLDWGISSTYVSYGGPHDLWGQTWTPSDINNANFGAVLSATLTITGEDAMATIDHVRITVYYTPGAGGTGTTGGGSQSGGGGESP